MISFAYYFMGYDILGIDFVLVENNMSFLIICNFIIIACVYYFRHELVIHAEKKFEVKQERYCLIKKKF